MYYRSSPSLSCDDHSTQRLRSFGSPHVHILIVFVTIFRAVDFVVFVEIEQLVLPLFASLATVLSGVATSFLCKSNFVVVETEGHRGVPVKGVSKYWHRLINRKCLHSIASLGLEQKTVNSINDVLEGGVSSPVAVKDTVANAAVAIHVTVIERRHEATLGREGREVLGHL